MEELQKLSKDVETIPNLKYIISTLTEIFEYISKNEMIELKEKDFDAYKQNIRLKFPEFEDNYFSLFNVILDGELDSITHLVMMIKTLCMVKTGQLSMDTAFTNVREELSNRYIYPQFGGKQEFENTMIARANVKKEKSKKKNKKYGLQPK
jgi:hypothetical protein